MYKSVSSIYSRRAISTNGTWVPSFIERLCSASSVFECRQSPFYSGCYFVKILRYFGGILKILQPNVAIAFLKNQGLFGPTGSGKG